MSVLLWILAATGLISLISFIGVLTLAFKKDVLMKALMALVAFAAGSLLGVAIFDLVPEALEAGANGSLYIALGIFVFFSIERFIGWHHLHHKEDVAPEKYKEHHHDHTKPFVYTNLLAESVHNFIDGIIIASSFIVNIPLGITTTIAVAAHEIPQEIGDFAILVHGGLKIKKALLYNFISAITAIAGGILAFFLIGIESTFNPIMLGIAGGGFLYLALADLIPEIHKEKNWKKSLVEFAFLVIGLFVVYSMGILLPD